MPRLILSLLLAICLPGLAGAELPRSTFVYKTVDDIPIHADVYRADDSVQRPVIAWFHGGALIVGNRQGIPRRMLELSEKEGYVLVSFDYRLAPQVTVSQIIDDLRDGLTWLRRRGAELFDADPSKLVVSGGSAGGYLTMMSGIAIDPPPTALVAYWGYGDIDGDWLTKPNEPYRKNKSVLSKQDAWAGVGEKVITGTDATNQRGRGAFYMYLRQTGLWAEVVGGFDPATERDKFTPFCPVRNLSEQYPPILMVHGTADLDVPYSKSADMARELKRLGVQHELLRIEGGGHGLGGGDAKEIEKAYARSLEFIRERLSGD